MLSLWILAKVFASGCTAMTGVEAVSNGVMAFREPTQKNAKRTLTIIILLLMIFLAGIALLCRAYSIGATDPGAAGYQSILSQLTAAVMGRGWFYYVTIGSILAVLALSANTSYADFPRLTRAIAQRDYLPHVFLIRGRRLLYSHGIYALVGFTALLLIVFHGVTDWLIPLFAIGAFLAFTLSQAGMVVHWKRVGGNGAGRRMLINGIGAVATGITLLVVLVAKFTSGAWITAILVPALMIVMTAVKRHYDGVAREIAVDGPMRIENLNEPLIIIPMDRWSRLSEKALRFAMKLSDEVQAVHVDAEECYEEVRQMWQRNVAVPFQAGRQNRTRACTRPVALSLRPGAAGGLHPQGGSRVSRPPGGRPRPRTRRQTLVADSAAQPARPGAEAAAADARQPAHYGHHHPLVPVGLTSDLWPQTSGNAPIARSRYPEGCGNHRDIANKWPDP